MIKINNIEKNKCSFGCGKTANYITSSGKKYCCSSNWSKCEAVKIKNILTNKIMQSENLNGMYGKKHTKNTKDIITMMSILSAPLSKIKKQNTESNTIKLCELFNTFQGEGPDSGRRMTLIRLRRCDRVERGNPCPWCDTLSKMTTSKETKYDISYIQSMVDKTKSIMLSGGEPGFKSNIKYTKQILQKLNFSYCNIETNGCHIYEIVKIIKLLPRHKKVKIMYSPKIFSCEEYNYEIKKIKKILKNPEISNYITFKFVNDGSEFTNLILEDISKLEFRNDAIWIMPEGKTSLELLRNAKNTIDICSKYSFNFSSRDHIVYNFT